MTHAIIGRIDAAVESVLLGNDRRRNFVCRFVRIRLRPAVGEHARPTVDEISRRETRGERQRRHRVALKRRKPLIDCLHRLVCRALPADGDEERQLPKCLGKAALALEHQGQMLGAGATGVGHVHMRIGPIGDQGVRMLDHLRAHIGVQVETDHQRHVLADQFSHAREDFALPVVEMLGHHRPMQIEIDAVNRAGRRKSVEQHRNDAFECIFRDMRRRRRTAGDGRRKLPAFCLSRLDKPRKAEIDAAHDLEKAGTLRHRQRAAALYESLVRGLGWSEGVGLVQKAADGNTCHQSSTSHQVGVAPVAAVAATGRKLAKSHPRPGAASISMRV